MKVMIGIVLALGVAVAVFSSGINEDHDYTNSPLYGGIVTIDESHSPDEIIKACPEIMMATVYTVPTSTSSSYGNTAIKQEVQPTLYAYDKYGSEVVVHHGYESPESTYSYEVDANGNLSEIVWHDFTQGSESEFNKTVLEYYPEGNAVGITRWYGPVKDSPDYHETWNYQFDDNGLVTERTETHSNSGTTTIVYRRDVNGNVKHELEYDDEGQLWWDWSYTYDSYGHEIAKGLYDMEALDLPDENRLAASQVYTIKAVDEYGNWTCRIVDFEAIDPSGQPIVFGSHMEYRSILYYPD